MTKHGSPPAVPLAVAWHDVECGGYDADLPLWRALAEREDGPVLDVGAGTGRVALDLAARGHEVVALDRESELLAALAERAHAAGVTVRTVVADAERLPTEQLGRFGLVLVPMQTVQLLADRSAFLRGAAAVLRRGGLLAVAVADELTSFEPTSDALPEPDVGGAAGWRYVSQPTAVRLSDGVARIERTRTALAPDGTRTVSDGTVQLARLDAPALVAEGRAAGLKPVPGERIPATDEHVGSAVVTLRA